MAGALKSFGFSFDMKGPSGTNPQSVNESCESNQSAAAESVLRVKRRGQA
jgi:hypothetical protein